MFAVQFVLVAPELHHLIPGFVKIMASSALFEKPIYVFLHNNFCNIRVTNVYVTYSLQWKQNRYSSHSLSKLNKLVFKINIFLKYCTRL